MKKFLTLALVLACSSFMSAQTVEWSMQPTDYNEITRLYENLYKVVRNGKIGLVNSDGSIVAPVENDEIGRYYDHRALLTSNDGKGERITGYITDEGKYFKIAGTYYAINNQKFFSDGVISVSDGQGRLGYIDYLGNVVTAFDDGYTRIKPFVEGYATVYKDKKYYLINKEGSQVRFILKSVGEIYGGTNVYNGIVYVWNSRGRFFTYDINEGGTCKKSMVPADIDTFDYLYRFASISGDPKTVPYTDVTTSGKRGIEPIEKDGKYGFREGVNATLPCQLTSATRFEDNISIVRLNGKMGMLKYVPVESFHVTAPEEQHDFYIGDSVAVTCKFNVNIPDVWRTKSIDVILTNSNGTAIDISRLGASFKFDVLPTEEGRKDYNVAIYGEGLKLCEKSIHYIFLEHERCKICGLDTAECEGHEVKEEPKKKDTRNPGKGTITILKPPTVKCCKTCGKPISACKYQGVH